MAITPPVTVEAPTARGPRYGLFTAASGPLPLPDTERARGKAGGVRYEPTSCGRARRYPVDCDDTPGSKTFDPNDDYIDALPFVVYSSIECGSVGKTAEAITAKLLHRLANGEQGEVEAELADLLNADSVPVSPGDPTDIVYVISELEQYLYGTARYGNVGVIHAPILVAAHAAAAGHLIRDPAVKGLLTTPLGTAWSFGNYGDAGTMWITGSVTVWRADDIYIPPPEQTFDRTHNQWMAIAEREYAVAWDCVAAQAHFTPDSMS